MRSRISVTTLLRTGFAACLLLYPLASPADDWPQWRGPSRDNVWAETGVLESLPAAGLKVRWRVPVGFGFSSPVVAGGLVYVSDLQLDRIRSRERLVCVDEITGRVRWTHAYPVDSPEWAFTPGQETGPNATPIVDSGKVYMLGWHGHLSCLDAATGEVRWLKNLAEEFPAGELRTTGSPLIEGDLLVLVIGGKPDACVVALDKNSGREKWRALPEPAGYSSPVVVEAGGVRQLIVWTMESASSLDPATGRTHWRVPLSTPADTVISTPVARDGRLLVGGVMLQLDPGRPAASILWPENPKPRQRYLSVTSTAFMTRQHVYSALVSGELACFDASTGQRAWVTNAATDVKHGASIHIMENGGSVLLFNDRGELIRARLRGDGYEEISRAKVIEPTAPFAGRNVAWAPPALANGHIVVRSGREMIRASLKQEP